MPASPGYGINEGEAKVARPPAVIELVAISPTTEHARGRNPPGRTHSTTHPEADTHFIRNGTGGMQAAEP